MESQELQQDAPRRDANPPQIGQKPIYCPPELILIFKFYLYSGAVRVQYRTCVASSGLICVPWACNYSGGTPSMEIILFL